MADVTQTVTAVLRVEYEQWAKGMKEAAKAAKDAARAAEAGTKGTKKGFDEAGDSAERAGRKYKKSGTEAEESSDKAAKAAAKAAREQEKAAARAAAAAAKARREQLEAIDTFSNMTALGGGALVALSVGQAKAAMDWQSAWTGVTKTVDGTPEQLAAVEQGLRDLAKTLPATHQEIAAVAENAGQLGVARDDIVGFTRTMIDLGETTNLTADEAATNIAQISNVMGTMSREGSEGVSRFGATLVALGNDGASTEAEILNMAQRMAGAVKTLGGSESDLLALSNTLASMGVRAELGGGVATRVLLKMRAAADEGGDKLQAFATVAGVSADEFGAKFKASPMEALDMVAKGIKRVNDEGGNVTATLKDMGMKGTEETQVMLALANSGDLLTESLQLGNSAWAENTALAAEAAKRYATAESKIQVAWNTIKDAAITAGGAILPMVSSLAEAVAGLAGWFGDLPAPLQQGISGLTLFGGAALITMGAIGKLYVKIDGLRTVAANAGGSLKTMGLKAGLAGGAVGLAAAGLAIWAQNAAEAAARTEEYRGTLDSLGRSTDATVKHISEKLAANQTNGWDKVFTFGMAKDRSLIDMADQYGVSVKDMTSYVSDAAGAQDGLNQKLDAYVKSLPLEEQDRATEGKNVFLNALNRESDALTAAQKKQAQAAMATEENGVASEENAAKQQELAGALEQVGVSAEGAVDSMSDFLDVLFQTGMLNMDAREAASRYQEALKAIDEAQKEVAKGELGKALTKAKDDFDLTTEAGRLADGAMRDLAQGGMNEVKAMVEQMTDQGASQVEMQDAVRGRLQATYDDLKAEAEQWGMSTSAAADYAREVMGIPDKVSIKSWMDTTAKETAEATKAAVDAIPKLTKVAIEVSKWTKEYTSTFEGTYSASGGNKAAQNAMRRAGGGSVFGPGTETSDSIPVWMSTNEHVLSAREVRGLGGHGAVEQLRAMARTGNAPAFRDGGTPARFYAPAQGFANGGRPVPQSGGVSVINNITVKGDPDPGRTADRVMAKLNREFRSGGMRLGS